MPTRDESMSHAAIQRLSRDGLPLLERIAIALERPAPEDEPFDAVERALLLTCVDKERVSTEEELTAASGDDQWAHAQRLAALDALAEKFRES